MFFTPSLAFALPAPMNRRLLIAAGVLLLHLGVLWALQTGLVRRPAEIVIPAQIISEFIHPSAPPAPEPRHTPAAHRLLRQTPAPQSAPQPLPQQPLAITPEPAPPLTSAAPAAPTQSVAVEASPVAAAPLAAPPAAPPAPPRIELPSSEAAYLNNPEPPYPALSRRLGEQGTVVVRALIGIDGRPQQAEIRQSSGYERLDQAALQAVRSWRFVPGTRNGIPEAMWVNVPIRFILK